MAERDNAMHMSKGEAMKEGIAAFAIMCLLVSIYWFTS